MLLPALDGFAVARDPDGGENRVPELLHRLRLGAVREDLLRPAGHRDSPDGPGNCVGHLEPAELLQIPSAGAGAADQPVLVHALQNLRVRPSDVEEGRARPGVIGAEANLPLRDGVENIIRSVEEPFPVQLIVSPADNDLAAARRVSGLRAQPREPGAVHRAADDQVLSFLDVYAYFYQEFGVLFKFFLHGLLLSFLRPCGP